MDLDTQTESVAAILAFPALTLPTFTAEPRGLARGSEGVKLAFPSHPQLAKTHRIRGHEAAISVFTTAVLDFLTDEPVWAIEGKDNKLVICRTSAPRDRSGVLTAEEVTDFVDAVFRIAALFRGRWSDRARRS